MLGGSRPAQAPVILTPRRQSQAPGRVRQGKGATQLSQACSVTSRCQIGGQDPKGGSPPIAEELNLIAHLVPGPRVHDPEQSFELFANRKPLLLADNNPSVVAA